MNVRQITKEKVKRTEVTECRQGVTGVVSECWDPCNSAVIDYKEKIVHW